MTLSDVAIRRPVFTAMMSLTLVVLGVLGYRRLGTDLYPDVSFPFVTITTAYPGASPEDIEESVTRPIEDAVSSIPGIKNVFYDVSAQPVLVFSAASADDPIALREKLDDQVRPRIEQLEGVAAVRIVGGGEPEISVELFRDRLVALGLSPDAVFDRIRGEHGRSGRSGRCGSARRAVR